MTRTIAYWVTTGVLAVMSAFAGLTYLLGSPQAIQAFGHLGYPQPLRIILGIAKLLGAILLVVPGLTKLQEWAYAGFAFAWILAFVAHDLAKDGSNGIHSTDIAGASRQFLCDPAGQSSVAVKSQNRSTGSEIMSHVPVAELEIIVPNETSMASTAKISGSTDSKQPTADVQKQDRPQDSTPEQEIRRRAYEIYLERGAQSGRGLEDWLNAEHEVTT